MFNKLFRELAMVAVALAIGAVSSLVAFFGVAFLFAGAEGDTWVRWFFGYGSGLPILTSTLTIGVFAHRIIRKRGLRLA